MTTLTDEAIDRIGRGLLARTLAKSEWTHAAHFAAGLWLLRRNGSAAFDILPGAIRAYNEATGVANTDTSGYHETITLASLRVAYTVLAETRDEPLSLALGRLLSDRFGRSDWILAHWSRERLFSPEARRQWIEPDLAPLPMALT